MRKIRLMLFFVKRRAIDGSWKDISRFLIPTQTLKRHAS